MFGKVVWYAVGPTGLLALDILMISFLMGILVTYMNAMRSFLQATPLTTHSDLVDAILLVAIMGPLSCVPHIGYLSQASAMGLLVLMGTFIVLGVYGLDEWYHRHNNNSEPQQQHPFSTSTTMSFSQGDTVNVLASSIFILATWFNGVGLP